MMPYRICKWTYNKFGWYRHYHLGAGSFVSWLFRWDTVYKREY